MSTAEALAAMRATLRSQVLPHYGINADAECAELNLAITPLGDGLINQTFLVRWAEQAFVLQRINTHVFPDPQALISNAILISQKLLQMQVEGQYSLRVVQPIATQSGDYFVDLGEDGFWRAINFIGDSESFSIPQSLPHVYQGAQAFGQFCAALATIDISEIQTVIPNFHHLPHRLAQLQQAQAQASPERALRASHWLKLIQAQTGLVDELEAVSTHLPMRICHYDTKLNNMLFSKGSHNPLAVIDLDTCMPGYLMYDFGDMVRAMCASSKEDMHKFDDVFIKPDAFSQLAKGYLSALKGVITAAEIDSLWLGVKLVILELAVRFLTDYLNGDLYFQTEYPEHNLDRARNQFTLFQSALAQEQTLSSLIPSIDSSGQR